MRILLDARTVGREFSGVGNYVQELVRAFSRLEADHDFVLGVNGASGRLRDQQLDARFRFFDIPFSHENHPLGDLWEDHVLPRRAAQGGVDVIHGPAFLIPTRPTRVTKVVTIHDLVAFTHPETVPWKYAMYMRRLIRRAVRSADRVITVSDYVHDDLVRRLHVSPRKLESVRSGVSDDFRRADDTAVERVRERFSLRRPYLLFVGNLEPRKNLPGLVRAFREVRARAPQPVDLVVCGKVAWKSEALLRELSAVDLAGSVHVTGYVRSADLPALYSGAEVFVFPSFWEGFGFPVLEAMACGTPVVSSNVSSIPEVAGDAALLVDPRSLPEISEAVLLLLRDGTKRSELVRKGLERARAFSWSETARRTLETYRHALQSTAAQP
jgi:glycosyltransferase involved in cell wall biosynthesis